MKTHGILAKGHFRQNGFPTEVQVSPQSISSEGYLFREKLQFRVKMNDHNFLCTIICKWRVIWHPVNETTTSSCVTCRQLVRPPNKTLSSISVLLMMANKVTTWWYRAVVVCGMKLSKTWPQEICFYSMLIELDEHFTVNNIFNQFRAIPSLQNFFLLTSLATLFIIWSCRTDGLLTYISA